MSRSGLGSALGGMSDRDRRALGIVAIFLFVIAAYTQLIEPLIFRFDQALEKRDRAEQLSTGYIQKIRMLPRREKRLAELDREMRTLEAYFAQDLIAKAAPIETLIDELTAYASISGSQLRQLVPDVESLPDLEGRIHDLELIGDYAALRQYLYLLETSPRRFNLMELEINPPKDGQSRARMRFMDPMATPPVEMNPDQGEPLIIGVHGSAGDAQIYTADASGAFADASVAVGLVPAGSPQSSADRLMSGELDAVVGSLYDLIRYRLAGAPVRVLMPLGELPLSVSLVSRADSPLSGLEELSGKTLGIESLGMAEVSLLQRLYETGMSRTELGIVYLDRRAMVRHLRSGLIDAALVNDLNGARLDYLGMRQVEELPAPHSEWQAYLIVHADSLSRFPQRWSAVSRALWAAAEQLESGSPEAIALAHAWIRYRTPDATAALLSRSTFGDARDSIDELSSDATFGLESVQKLLLELGEPVPDISREELVEPSWLRSMGEVLGEG